MNSNQTQSIAALVAAGRKMVADNPETYAGDEIESQVMWLVTETPARTWSPSEIGRTLGISTINARDILNRLAGVGFIATAGRGGAWTRYTTVRRH